MTVTAYKIVQNVPFIVRLSMAALTQRNPASSGTSRDGSCVRRHDKRHSAHHKLQRVISWMLKLTIYISASRNVLLLLLLLLLLFQIKIALCEI